MRMRPNGLDGQSCELKDTEKQTPAKAADPSRDHIPLIARHLCDGLVDLTDGRIARNRTPVVTSLGVLGPVVVGWVSVDTVNVVRRIATHLLR